MTTALLGWIDRQGGMLTDPRRTLAELREDDGLRDGTWLLLAYLLAAHTGDVIAALARIVSLRSFDALLLGAADVAIGLVVPFVATFAVELLLGRGRSHRAALCLAPMLAIVAALHLLESFGVLAWPSRWVPGAIAAVPCLGFAAWLRPAIPLRSAGGGS